MRKKALLLVFSCLTSLNHPVLQAQETESGNAWLERCQSKEDWAQSACVWFVLGFENGITAQRVADGGTRIYCKPEHVTFGQMKDIWVKYMQDNPAERHTLGGILLMNSLMKAFPCAKASR